MHFFSGLRQVVSEVLFSSPVSSSPAQRSPVLPAYPPAGLSSTPPRSSGGPHDTQNSVEIIAQLLQEAEGELCACALHKQLASFIIHDRYFPFLSFQIQMKRILKMILYYKSFANNERGLGSKLG